MDSEVFIYMFSKFELRLIKILSSSWEVLILLGCFFLHPQDQEDQDLLAMCPPWSNLKKTYGNIKARYDQLEILGSQPVVISRLCCIKVASGSN